MTVFVVWNSFLEYVLGVYSTKEKAESFVSKSSDKAHLVIEEFEVI